MHLGWKRQQRLTWIVAVPGKAAKFLGKWGQKLARGIYADADASSTRGNSLRDAALGDAGALAEDSCGDNRSGMLAVLIGCLAECMAAGFKHGRLECYTPSGRLLWKKVYQGAKSSMQMGANQDLSICLGYLLHRYYKR